MRRRLTQSNIESQQPARASYVPSRAVLPRNYPQQARTTNKPAYIPRQRELPRDYPRVVTKRQPVQRLVDVPQIGRREKAPEKRGFTKAKPFTLTTFDARPINAIDFVDTFTAAEQVAGDTFTSTFTVPDGRVALVRNLALRVYMSAAARDVVTGAPTEALTLSFLVNGNAVEQANSIRVDDAICSPTFQQGLNIPLYFLAAPGSTITLTIANTAGGTTIAFAAPVLTGNLLLAEGVNPTSEPGTQWPLPIAGL